MSTDRRRCQPALDDFLARHREEILRSLHFKPMVQVTYADSPGEEELGITKHIYFGVYPRGTVFDVWTLHEDADDPLVWEDSFRSEHLAKNHLLLRASLVQAEKGELLDQQKDVLWEELKFFIPTHTAPFYFRHSTLCPSGCSLEFEADVIELFEQNKSLLDQDQMTAGDHASLYDANGSRCWVAVSHRGELVLTPYAPEPISRVNKRLTRQDQPNY